MYRAFLSVGLAVLFVMTLSVWAEFEDDFDSYAGGSDLPLPWSLGSTNDMVVNFSGWQGSMGVFANSAGWHGSSRGTDYDPGEVCYELSLKARISSGNGLARHTWAVSNGPVNLFFEMDQNYLEIFFPGGSVPFSEDVWYEISVALCKDAPSDWQWHGSYRAWTGSAWDSWVIMGGGDLPAGFSPDTVSLGGIYAFDVGDPGNSSMDDVSFVVIDEPSSCYTAIQAGFGQASDVNEDCYVDLEDFSLVANDWMQCMHPSDPACN